MDESQTQDEPDVQDEAPEQEAPTEVQEETPEVTPEAEAKVVDEGQESIQEEDSSDDDYQPQPTVAPPKLEVGEDGTLDVNQLNDWANQVVNVAQQRSAQEAQAQVREKEQWNSLYEKYPELKGNKKMRDLIHQQRMGRIVANGKDDVIGAWESIRKFADESKQQGVKSAQESIVRQKSANLESASTPNDQSSAKKRNEQLLDLSAARNRRTADEARHELLKGMIERGEI